MTTLMSLIALSNPFAQWGIDTLEQVRKEFTMKESVLLGEERTPNQPPRQVAFNWGVGVALSALNSAAKVDEKYKPWLAEYAEAIQPYWNDKGPVPGYDVLPGPKDVDRYYDDNAWMVMSLVETFEILKDRKHLDRARASLTYVFSGRDEKLGDGIYWRESDKASKNTCSNAPSVAAMMAVYEHTKEPHLLTASKEIYSWTKKTLQDPSDFLMWDAINLKDQEIGKYKWTYNTGLMIRSAKALYNVTGDKQYLQDAEKMQEASLAHWFPEGGKNGARCEGKFAHLLMESYAFKPAYAKGIEARNNALKFVHENVRDAEGRYGHRWERKAEQPYGKFSLIDQASAARAFLEAAL